MNEGNTSMNNNNKCATTVNGNGKSKIWKFLRLLLKPIYRQFPFVFLFLCMIDFWSVYNLALDCIDSPEKISSILSLPVLYTKAVILFLFAYIAAWVITVIRNRKLKRLVKTFMYGILLALFLLRFFLRHYFNLDININFFVLLTGASRTEIVEFVNHYIFSINALLILSILIIYAVVIFTLEYFWDRKKVCVRTISSRVKNAVSVVVLFLLLSGVYSTKVYCKLYSARSYEEIIMFDYPNDPISSTYVSLLKLRIMNNNVRAAIELNKDVYEEEYVKTVKDDTVNVVVVIGESYIKWHSQLYGYDLETTPNMYREMLDGRLFAFNDVISSSNSTSVVMRNTLCCNNSSAKEMWFDYPSFLTIFKKAGYNVYFWDNQCESSILSNYSFVLNRFLYSPETREVFFTKTNSVPFVYDADLVESLDETFDASSGQNNLVVFHLSGQHVAPSKRFPHDTFKYFTAENIKRNDAYLTEKMKEYIADYDNATLYNDYVMNKIFDKFKESNTILVYFSDHGEEAYDFREHCGRDHGELTPMVLKYQYDVPFVVWCSETYKKNNPDVVESIRQAVNRPFLIDNVCNMLFNLGGISTSYYREDLDLISPHYQCRERLLKGKFVYENIRYGY